MIYDHIQIDVVVYYELEDKLCRNEKDKKIK